jgi:hypothetical protein
VVISTYVHPRRSPRAAARRASSPGAHVHGTRTVAINEPSRGRAWGNVRSAYARLHRGTAYAYSVPPGTGRPYARRRVVAVIRLRNLQR